MKLCQSLPIFCNSSPQVVELSLFLFIFRKKPTKFGFFGLFLKVDRKLLKFYLQNTNFNMFFISF